MHDKRNYPFYPILKVSVPSFGDSFLYGDVQTVAKALSGCFRPLIRGFFFITVW